MEVIKSRQNWVLPSCTSCCGSGITRAVRVTRIGDTWLTRCVGMGLMLAAFLSSIVPEGPVRWWPTRLVILLCCCCWEVASKSCLWSSSIYKFMYKVRHRNIYSKRNQRTLLLSSVFCSISLLVLSLCLSSSSVNFCSSARRRSLSVMASLKNKFYISTVLFTSIRYNITSFSREWIE